MASQASIVRSRPPAATVRETISGSQQQAGKQQNERHWLDVVVYDCNPRKHGKLKQGDFWEFELRMGYILS